MKTKLALFTLLAVALLVASVSAGNGATENGKHYNLNLISIKNIDQLPTNDETNNGNRIFVNFDGRSKIYLQQNTDGIFNVMDYIATRNDPCTLHTPCTGKRL